MLNLIDGHAPGHRAPQRLRHARSLRRHDEGRDRSAICPDATLVDITHDIPAARRRSRGALELAAAYRYFPAGTIFLAVVDPGVGSARRGIAAEAGDYRFVAPDNGVLTRGASTSTAAARVVELTERRYARPTVSRTFEGRDRFAPAAAWLAKGIAARRRSAARSTRLRAARSAAPAQSTASEHRRRRAARRSLRQPGHQHRSARRSRRCAGGAARHLASAAASVALVVAPTPTSPPGEVVRALRQHRSSRDRRQRRERRRARSALGRGAPVDVVASTPAERIGMAPVRLCDRSLGRRPIRACSS